MSAFTPHLQILPPAQRRLWVELAAVPKGFVLYGGTAIGLWLDHRSSEDFDFFSSEPFVPADLLARIPFLAGGLLRQSEPNTLTLGLLSRVAGTVREIPEIPRRSDRIAPEA